MQSDFQVVQLEEVLDKDLPIPEPGRQGRGSAVIDLVTCTAVTGGGGIKVGRSKSPCMKELLQLAEFCPDPQIWKKLVKLFQPLV